jgi:ribonucleoside-triphosphate reductase
MPVPVIVRKRDGSFEPFNPKKTEAAVLKCLNSVQFPPTGWNAPATTAAKEAAFIAKQIGKVLGKRNSVDVEQIQDLVEIQLMNEELHEAARTFILYREEHRKLREKIDPADAALVRAQKQFFPTELQHFQFTDKYARYNAEKGRRETWPEAVDRVIAFLAKAVERGPVNTSRLANAEWTELREAMLRMEAMPSMRILQMAGPALERCNVGAYNCAYVPIDRPSAWSELLYVMMQGTGCGFSVEAEYVDQLPRVKRQKKSAQKLQTYVIPDTTEGWCHALQTGVDAWFAGDDVEFDYSRIRPQGTPLKTKGGRASGPEPLRNLLTFVRGKILSRQGRRLKPIDAHDIACYCGDIVQVGGVRRAAEISLSDLDDLEMRRAKFGSFWASEPYRQMANNSAVYWDKPTSTAFMEEWLSLAQSGSGERGIFNRGGAIKQIPKRRKKADFGANPCGEIFLRPRQFCNLSIAIARPDDTADDLRRKVRIAAIFGTLQSTLTNFKYLPEEWRKNCEEERLLGVDITGQMDCPLLQPDMGYGSPGDGNDSGGDYGRQDFLSELRVLAVQTNLELSERLGIPQSTAVTCVKPSGNSSVLFNCAPGMHPRFAPYYIRRVRVESFTPMAKLLKAEGVTHQVGPDGSYRFEFPIASSPDALVTGKMTALDQLHNWLTWKEQYTEHNPSITVYVGADEWLAVGDWVYANWDKVGGLSFLPRTDAVYQLAPYEEISKDEYEKRAAAFPKVDYAKLAYYEGGEDNTTSSQEFACSGDKCEVA